ILSASTRVAENQSLRPVSRAAPEFKEDISANRHTDERRATDSFLIADSCQIVGMLRHRRWPLPNFRIPVPTHIRKDQAISVGQPRHSSGPELMMHWKRMEKQDSRTTAHSGIDELRVICGDSIHASGLWKLLRLGTAYGLAHRNGSREQMRFLRHHDPCHWVGEETDERHHTNNQPQYANQRDI